MYGVVLVAIPVDDKSRISKGKRRVGWSLEETRHKLPGGLSVGGRGGPPEHAAHDSSQEPPVAWEQVRCGSCELRCALSGKCTLGFRGLVGRKQYKRAHA